MECFCSSYMEKRDFKTLVERAYVICSPDQLLRRELRHVAKVFHEKNNYPK